MNPRELIRLTASRFFAAGIPDPDNDSALLLSFLCGRPPLELRLDTDTVLSGPLLDRFQELADRRLQRIPLQYLLSEVSFCGRMFRTDPRALIPRPETEQLCLLALQLAENRPSPRVLDLCCGSGCIGLTIKAERPDTILVLSDLSADALALAEENRRRLGLEAELRRNDLLDGFPDGSFDLIVCNPPYIPSSECASLQPEVRKEPLMALDGGPDGLAFYRRLIPCAAAVLASGGAIALEVGFGEASAVADLLAGSGFVSVGIHKDLAGIDRMISARIIRG